MTAFQFHLQLSDSSLEMLADGSLGLGLTETVGAATQSNFVMELVEDVLIGLGQASHLTLEMGLVDHNFTLLTEIVAEPYTQICLLPMPLGGSAKVWIEVV